jgi:hypothetical protein
LSAAGVLVPVAGSNSAAVLGGMVLFGAGFGLVQSASLNLMFERVAKSDYGTVSAVWNVAYDTAASTHLEGVTTPARPACS